MNKIYIKKFLLISCFISIFFYFSNGLLSEKNETKKYVNFAYEDRTAPILRHNEGYIFQKVLLDVGVYPTREYYGNGVNIGVMENAFINDDNGELDNITYNNNLNDFYYELDIIGEAYRDDYLSKQVPHASNVATILAGNNSIASQSQLLSSSYTSSATIDSFEWFEENDADVISSSTGLVMPGESNEDIHSGYYSNISDYLDNFILNNGTLYVTAIGNQSDNHIIASQSLALNAISVGASTKEFVADNSINADESHYIYDDIILSPTILAPGADLFNISGINYNATKIDDLISGTSWSAPIVSGIIALLMEEFPFLKRHPEMVIPLICNTATKAANQTEFVDRTNGFGIINYSEAQKAANNTRSIVLDSNTPADSLIYEEYVTLQANESIDITAFTLYDARNNDFFNTLDFTDYVDPSSMQFSKVKIKLIDTMKNHAVYSDSISNFSYVSDVNPLYTHTYKIEVYLDGEQKEPLTTKIGLNYNIHKGHAIELNLIDGNYLDECPTFEIDASDYNQTISYYNYDVTLVFVGQDGKVLFKKEDLDRIDTITLTEDEWDEIIWLRGREYYAYVECRINDDFFVSKPFVFYEPEDFNNLIQIKPHEYNFEQQYFFEEKTTNFIKNDVNFSTKRLRCGYIEDTYVVLSPRNINAGTAYFELTFDRPMYGFMVGITVWSDFEYLFFEKSQAHIEVKDSNGNWIEEFNILYDVALPENRMDIYRFVSQYSEPIYGIKIVAENKKIRDDNKGRICIDDIVLLDNQNQNFISNRYESIVVDDSYYSLRYFYEYER